jgi:rhamnogalacturonyl hydrolase YesR
MNKFIIILLLSSTIIRAQVNNAEKLGDKIIDRIIHDTSFELVSEIQKPTGGIEVIDFQKLSCSPGIFYALSFIKSEKDTVIDLGISFNKIVNVIVNNKSVFLKDESAGFRFKETAYGIFEFNDTMKLKLKKGYNKILIKSYSEKRNDFIYLREITLPEETPFIKFTLDTLYNNITGDQWIYCGPFEKNKFENKLPPENEFQPIYKFGNEYLSWKQKPVDFLIKAKIPEDAVYNREAYSEWTYANGAMMFAILEFSKRFSQKKYTDFVKQFCDFTISNLALFKKQYFEDHAFRGFNHRIFRKTMLDDAGSPTLPFLQLVLDGNGNSYENLVDEMLRYVIYDQKKLEDKTFSRLEPVAFTVWADDLFMSVPLILRYAKLTNNEKLYDLAALQVINFNKYLFDPPTRLYKHSYFVVEKKTSEVFWGRANGWVAWATSDALLNLPESHKDFKKILKIFQNHIKGLISVQDNSGMWHQILDDKSTYEETSCTAMFIIALARGIKNSWLDKKYEANLFNAWKAFSKNISDDGVVKNICRGTGVGYSYEFYAKRATYSNDPRGLGAVITACKEMADYLTKK